jgi:serine protease Do
MDISLNTEAKLAYVKGLNLEEITENVRQKYQIPSHIKGVLISGVKASSPAQKLGFMPGDIVVQVNQTTIETIEDLKNALNSKKKKVVFVNRNGYHKPIVIK